MCASVHGNSDSASPVNSKTGDAQRWKKNNNNNKKKIKIHVRTNRRTALRHVSEKKEGGKWGRVHCRQVVQRPRKWWGPSGDARVKTTPMSRRATIDCGIFVRRCMGYWARPSFCMCDKRQKGFWWVRLIIIIIFHLLGRMIKRNVKALFGYAYFRFEFWFFKKLMWILCLDWEF